MAKNILSDELVYSTNYDVAVHWLNNSFIMCNNLPEIDGSIYDNARFDICNPVNEVFQWFITSCSESDVEFLEEHFAGLCFTYSGLLNVWVLCVTHWGTSWDYVHCFTDLECAERELGKSK